MMKYIKRIPLLLFITTIAFLSVSEYPSLNTDVKINTGFLTVAKCSFNLCNELSPSFKHSQSLFSSSFNIYPQNWQAYVGLADLYVSKAMYQKAIEYWNMALEKGFSDRVLLFQIGEAYNEIGDHNNALIFWRDARAEEKFYNEGNNWLQNDDLNLAHKNYRLAVEINPNYILAENALNQVVHKLFWQYRNKGEHDQAVSILEDWINFNPTDKDFKIMGDYALERNDFPNALYWYKHGALLFPDNMNLSIKYSELSKQTGNIQRSELDLRHSILENPNDAHFYHLLGLLLFEEGKYSYAKQELLKSIELESNSIWTYIDLGEVYKIQDQAANANKEYRLALGVSPQNSRFDNLIKKIFLKTPNN